MISSTWGLLKKSNKMKMILVQMILVFKMKNHKIKRVKKAVAQMVEMMIFLEIKGQQESSK